MSPDILARDVLTRLAIGLARGELCPVLGPGALAGVVERTSGEPIPADSDSLILGLNNGRPMAPRLMWEFSRAAMHVELRRGRGAVNRFLVRTYAERAWTRAPLHDWLARLRLPYVIDLNRDGQLQELYAERSHLLVRGVARLGGTPLRFRLHQWESAAYRALGQEAADWSLPILFKPLGSAMPDPSFVASDADYVDYLTELMGGFAVPDFIKGYRRGRQYVFLGLRLTRDTERMLATHLIAGAGSPAGWALISAPTAKERRFCARLGIEMVAADAADLLAAAGSNAAPGQSGADPLASARPTGSLAPAAE